MIGSIGLSALVMSGSVSARRVGEECERGPNAPIRLTDADHQAMARAEVKRWRRAQKRAENHVPKGGTNG